MSRHNDNPPEPAPLLSVRLSVRYETGREALRDAAFDVQPEEILGLVGQSGSGKSTIALALMGLLGFKGGRASGEVRFGGRDLLRLSERHLRTIRGRDISLVPQSPLSSLNPALTIGAHFKEAWRAHALPGREQSRVEELLAAVQLPSGTAFLNRKPGQLSVGQAQRVLIALALLHRPELLIADEPTAALDPITAAEVLELFANLNREFRMAILYVSHDLQSVRTLCHRMAVLHEGRIVETGAPSDVLMRPEHAYTKRLVATLPSGFAGDLFNMAEHVRGEAARTPDGIRVNASQ